VFLFVGITGVLVNITLLLLMINSNGIHELFSIVSISRLLWVFASIGYILLIGIPNIHSAIRLRHKIIFFCAAALSLLFSGIIIVFHPTEGNYTFVYIINCMITGSFLCMSFSEILAVITPTICYYLFTFI